MKDDQSAFIHFAIENKVLQFGEFILKSGRKSPYFFNAGLFNTGEALAKLGAFYASALVNSNLDYDTIFGTAYKGIPLASATAISLFDKYNINIPWCFNRKETKDHGEGGIFVGYPKGRVAIIDDVITAGTATKEAINLIKTTDSSPCLVIIALNRQEIGTDQISAITQIENDYNIPIISIINLDQIFSFVKDNAKLQQYANAIDDYRNTYGIV